MRRTLVCAVGALFGLAAAGCGAGGSADQGGGGKSTLTVYAAASLTESFNELRDQFQRSHPNVTVKIDYAGSSSLVQRINNGAPADVFASANRKNMNKLVKAGNNDGKPQLFASNVLEIATAPGNPKQIRSFGDLAKPGLSVVACAPQVPCGAATQKVEKATGTELKLSSEEQNVKSVLQKVQSGDADAGLVYVTDVQAAGKKVGGVKFRESSAAVNQYPVVRVHGSRNPEAAKQFIDALRGKPGRAALTSHGFTVK